MRLAQLLSVSCCRGCQHLPILVHCLFISDCLLVVFLFNCLPPWQSPPRLVVFPSVFLAGRHPVCRLDYLSPVGTLFWVILKQPVSFLCYKRYAYKQFHDGRLKEACRNYWRFQLPVRLNRDLRKISDESNKMTKLYKNQFEHETVIN